MLVIGNRDTHAHPVGQYRIRCAGVHFFSTSALLPDKSFDFYYSLFVLIRRHGRDGMRQATIHIDRYGSKIYTKTGDAGETGLFGGQRCSKADLRIKAVRHRR
jgi:hypothetical protein